MTEEPIRLVCPDCDTVHRVKHVTLGKLYRCKKCKTGLITMSPAALVCASCGHSIAPSHVEVSRLITCQRCGDAPLMKLEFPPPVRPAPELQNVRSYDPPSDSIPIHTEAEVASSTLDESDSVLEEILDGDEDAFEGAPESGALALPGQEDRAVGALKKVLEDVQAPLIDEIERSRASVPVWFVMVAVLPFLLLLGFLLNGFLRSGTRAEEIASLEEKIRNQRQQITEVKSTLEKLIRERNELASDYSKTSKRLEDNTAISNALKKLLERRQQSINQYRQLNNALKQRLRALGVDPETVASSNSTRNNY